MEAYLWLFLIPAVLVSIACILYILSWAVQLLNLAWRLFVAFAQIADRCICWLLHDRRYARQARHEADEAAERVP